MPLVHGTCVDIGGVGILIRGEPGSGKSDLGLRLIAAGARLVGDDYVSVRAFGEALYASAPDTILGLIEVRGIGVVRLPHKPATRLGLVIDLARPESVPRLPEATFAEIDGVAVRTYRLDPFEASAPVKVRIAAEATRNAIVTL